MGDVSKPVTVKLPVQPLHNPFTPDDYAAFHYLLNTLHAQIEDTLQRAALIGIPGIDQRSEKHEAHKAILETTMKLYPNPHQPGVAEL
jgi:hypothetical protein